MKKSMIILAAITILSLTACADSEHTSISDISSTNTTDMSESSESRTETPSAATSKDSGVNIPDNNSGNDSDSDVINAWDRIPMIRVNGIIYMDTGSKSTIDGRCGNMDGEISSSVDGSLIPTENNQSNFGAGYGYQYGLNGTIDLYINDDWQVFASESYYYEDSVQEKLGLHLDIKELSSTGAIFTFSQYDGSPTGDLQFGDEYIIEKKNDEEWEAVDTVIDNYAWNAVAFIIQKDSVTEWKIDWEWLYGELPPGKYRLYKEIMDFRKSGDFDKYPIYAHFEIL